MANEPAPVSDRYRWVALTNTTASMFMATLDGSIVIIALPAIFRGIGLDPLAPGSIFYLLWMIMGYRLVQAVAVVGFGRLGDMYGRVKIYNAGFVVFTIASILLSFDPFRAAGGAMWLIGWRVPPAIGGAMLMVNSHGILTDAGTGPGRGPGRCHGGHPALSRPGDGLDQPGGDRLAGRGRGAARRVLCHRAQHRRADVPAQLVPDQGVHGRQHRRPAHGHRPGRPAVRADHLAARDLAAVARL